MDFELVLALNIGYLLAVKDVSILQLRIQADRRKLDKTTLFGLLQQLLLRLIT